MYICAHIITTPRLRYRTFPAPTSRPPQTPPSQCHLQKVTMFLTSLTINFSYKCSHIVCALMCQLSQHHVCDIHLCCV